jgi:hypothetical protein
MRRKGCFFLQVQKYPKKMTIQSKEENAVADIFFINNDTNTSKFLVILLKSITWNRLNI